MKTRNRLPALLLYCLASGNCGGTDPITDIFEPTDTRDATETVANGAILAGTGARNITPDFEPYSDTNDNRVWDTGEPFENLDDDGTLDSLYLGGFGVRQPTGVHDDLTVRTVALQFGDSLFTLTVADALALSMGRIRSIKDLVSQSLDSPGDLPPSHMIVSSTHTHAAPDNTGIFGPDSLEGSWDPDYLDRVVEMAAQSIIEAIGNLEAADILVTHANAGELVRDIVPPSITDPYVGIVQARKAGVGTVIATLVSIANHPETAWGDNTLISADYPHFLREKIEAEAGGLALHFSAGIGLMQTPAEIGESGFDRAQRVGHAYADKVLAALEGEEVVAESGLVPAFGRREPSCVLQNAELYIGVAMGVAEGYKEFLYHLEGDDRCEPFGCFDLPVNVLKLGDELTVVTFPGEVTPELIVGGITPPQEEGWILVYPDAPPEPILVDHLTTRHRFVIGLAEAEVGYIFPKMTFAPADVFSQSHGPGADTAGCIMTATTELLDSINGE